MAAPFSLNKSISALLNGSHQLTVRVCDAVDNCAAQKINFSLTNNSRPKKFNIGVSLTQPAPDTNLFKYDFPLALKATVTNQDQVAAVIFFLKDSSGNLKQLAQSQAKDGLAQATVNGPLAPGAYRLYAQARGWQEQTAVSAEITVTAKSLPPAAAAATSTPTAAQ